MQKKTVEKKNFQRMCVMCRNRFDKSSLTRFVVSDGKVVVDEKGNAQGRGAYVCDNPDCRLNLVKKKALSRVFHCDVSQQEYASITEQMNATKR